MKSRLIAFLLSCTALLSAEELQMDGFTSENITVGTEYIHIVSAFDQVTFFTTYSMGGDPIWEVPFNSEILYWKSNEEQIFIVSKARNKLAYYLTCLDVNDGMVKWERGIFAPDPS